MSILSWLLKSKKEMAKPNTKRVRIGKYKVSSHAQNRFTQKDRKVSKLDVVDNLLTKPNAVTKIKYDSRGRPSYNRIGKKATTSINPTDNVVSTIRHVNEREAKKYNLIRRRNGKYVKKTK